MGLFSRSSESAQAERGQSRPDVPAVRISAESAVEEIHAGHEYQRELLPKEPPEIPGYEFGFTFIPARGVSGDFYDFILLPDGRLGIVNADASGKGVAAGLATMTCRAMLRAQPEPEAGPARAFANVNAMIRGNIRSGMFVSAAYGILDPATHVLTVANAGHLPVVIWHSRQKVATVHPSKGPVLGVLPAEAYDVAIQEEEIPLGPGDRFVMLTDGLNEAMAPGQKEFGMEHLRRRLQAESDGPSREFLRHLMSQIDIHRSGGEQSDDITIVTGRRLPE